MATAQKAGRERKLTLERIVKAALAQIDRDGASRLGIRGLARSLGVEPMSLYHHVDGIEGLRDAVVDHLVALTLSRWNAAGTPLARLEALARSFLDIAHAHPKAFVLVASRLWRTPSALASLRVVVELLGEGGLTQREGLRWARILGAYLNGCGLALAAWEQEDSTPTRSAVASDGAIKDLSPHVNKTAVRSDLDAGLRRILLAAFAAGSKGRP